METKIIFNGKAYSKIEDMPEDVRQTYQQALAQFADADKDGIPDILEGHGAGNVIAIQQSSMTVNGRKFKSMGEMPPLVRSLVNLALGQTDANRNGIPDALEAALSASTRSGASAGTDTPISSESEGLTLANTPNESERIMPVLERTANALESFLRVLLCIVVLATLGGAIFLMVKLDAGSRGQGGRFYVAIGALVILAAVDSQFRKLLESRYALISLTLLVFSGVLLLGLAWLLP